MRQPLLRQSYRNLLLLISGALLCLAVLGLILFINHPTTAMRKNLSALSNAPRAIDTVRVLEETAQSDERGESSFWLNSGGWAVVRNDMIQTVQNTLPSVSYWRLRYRLSNPLDTENGYRPQNIFRLITQSSLINSEQEVYARILRTNTTDSPNRNESNGILLMSRFMDSDNLYYAGVRVDGYAVIKEKRAGVYTTLALIPLFSNPDAPYDRNLRPNLLPMNTWIGLRLITRDRADGSVELSLYIDTTGSFEHITTVRDSTPLTPGAVSHGGIRTDFMDAEFRAYRILQAHDTING